MHSLVHLSMQQILWTACHVPKASQLPFHYPVAVKNPPANAGDVGSIPVSGRSPGEGNGNPPEYSCLRNPMDRGAWWAIVHGVAESWRRLNS